MNRLIRAGLTQPKRRTHYAHHSDDIGFRVDVTDIGAVLDLLDES